MNERIHFFIKIYLSHFILERVMLVVCERWVGYGDRLTIAALLPHLGWGCSTVGHRGPQALCLLLALTSASWLQLTQTALVILLSHAHLLPLFFRLFTQVHLLIDGSVEGQYITHACYSFGWISSASGFFFSVKPFAFNRSIDIWSM